jgi:hypothetical protein
LVGPLTVVAVMMCGERREHEASLGRVAYFVSFSSVKQQKYGPSVMVIFIVFSSDIDHVPLAVGE